MLPIERTIVPHAISEQVLATVTGASSVADAAELMTERRIGAVLVVDKGKLSGIFTERDALTRVMAAGRDPGKTQIKKVMTESPVTIRPTDTVADALALMNNGHFRHLPVQDGTTLLGIVSQRDLYRSLKEQMEADIILLAESLIQG